MEHKGRSLPVIALSMALGGLFVFGVGAVYMYSISPGESVAKQKPQTLTRFEDLPGDIQREYIHKNDVQAIASLGVVPSQTKELAVEVETPIEGTSEELKAQVLTLRQKNRFLFQDNLDLANKNWELAIRLNDEKKALDKERQKLQTQNLETMNQAEQQHYQNINDLTRRINDLQQESMRASREYETKIVGLENTLYELQKELREQSMQTDKEISVATKEQRISNSTLAEKNRYLLEQHKALQDKMSALLDEKEKALRESKNDTDQLRNMLREKEAEQNVILTNHTREILAQERKYNEAVQKVLQEMSALKQAHYQEITQKNSEVNALMSAHEQTLSTLRTQAIELEGKVQQERLAREKLQEGHKEALAVVQTQISTLETQKKELADNIKEIERIAQERVAQKDKAYAKALEEIKSQSLHSEERENAYIDELKQQLATQVKALEEAANVEKTLHVKIATLEASLQKTGGNITQALASNEDKHAKNYHTLNEKIIALEQERSLIITKATTHIDALEAKHRQQIAALEAQMGGLKNTLKTLEETHEKLQKENGSLKQTQDKQLLALKEEFEVLQQEIKAREGAYEAKIEQLNVALMQEQKESQALLKDAVLKKPELLASIACDDMESGTNEASLTCKGRVEEFLKEYEASHFFEVLPIVDDGGFATLKRVEQETRLGIPKEEIKRLTRLSNLGLGKERAATGGKLIEAYFDGLARVSYSSDLVEVPNKRGFVIRVYR
ncbi:MAG: hypothetical protein IBX45_04595 [Campylobacterales bacterium]|nr:hypothetical protein [Campylobacterales bacterium]